MANEEQLSILKQGVDVWNEWRKENLHIQIDLSEANLKDALFSRVNLRKALLLQSDLSNASLVFADLSNAILVNANLSGSDLTLSNLTKANLKDANLKNANLISANLNSAYLAGSNFSNVVVEDTIFGNVDLSETLGLVDISHDAPSTIGTDTILLSKGKIPEVFLKGCGLNDWEIEMVKLYNPELSNNERNKILYKIYDLQASQAIQVSPLFISYSHGDSSFVNKIEKALNNKGIRYWRDTHDMKAGRIETQIDRAISQNRTVLLVLSENSIKSDWVEHEVRTARGLEKDMGRDVLCPVALDDSWKSSLWPKRVMEQIMEYNILDFSAWEDEDKFEDMFRRLIDGLELFYKDKSHGE